MERTVLVCDECGKPATEQVSFKVGTKAKSLVKDLCDAHVSALTKNTRQARPGRRKAIVAVPITVEGEKPKRPRGRPRKSEQPAEAVTAPAEPMPMEPAPEAPQVSGDDEGVSEQEPEPEPEKEPVGTYS